MRTIERRFATVQTRASAATRSDSPGTVTGYSAVFNSLSQDLGGFRERVAPGAFRKSLANGADVRALVNHDPNLIIGRTKNGSLRLAEDYTGLRMECDLPNTTIGRDLYESVKRGDLSECSFGFTVDEDDWDDMTDPDDDTRRIPIRTLRSVGLVDCSIVAYPAYASTNVHISSVVPPHFNSIRSHAELFPEGLPLEIRSRIPEMRADGAESRRRHLSSMIIGL